MQQLNRFSVVIAMTSLSLAASCSRENRGEVKAELDTLHAQVAQLQQQARRAEDYMAIANLQAIYGYYVDKSQWDEAADLFAKDGTLEIAGRGLFKGQDHVRTYLHQLGAMEYGRLFNHMQLQPVIDVAADG